MNSTPLFRTALALVLLAASAAAQPRPTVTPDRRGDLSYERTGQHDANNIRTEFLNYGMVGNYFGGDADFSVKHSMEVPKGSGTNYTDGATPFILARVIQNDATPKDIMLTGYRERQEGEPFGRWVMRFEPRPGYFQADPTINRGRSIAISNDSRTWPYQWYDKLTDVTDPGWKGSWYGYFGKRPAADQESFFVMDDNYYTNMSFNPDVRDVTRRGLATSMEVRGFQWSNPQAGNVLFYHYDVVNEGTTDYNDNIFFGIYVDSGVGGSTISCDGVYESDDDNAYFDPKSFGLNLNLTYTWDSHSTGVSLTSNCVKTGYLGYAYLETPGNPFDAKDNDLDGITDEKRDGGPGTLIQGANAIRTHVNANYNRTLFDTTYGALELQPAFGTEYWWTGDEDLDWTAEFDDTGVDGIFGTNDTGEKDGMPTAGETNFDRTDVDESDQIGLTGFKMNRIAAGQGASSTEVDGIVFYNNGIKNWPKLLYDMWTDPIEANRYSPPLVLNYNIGFFFTSGTFKLQVGKQERFSLALAYGGGLSELRTVVKVVQKIYVSNYQFVVPPLLPALTAQVDDRKVKLTWSDYSERSPDPVTKKLDFEGYKVYRSTDPDFNDIRTISNGQGTGKLPFGTPIAQFDLDNAYDGFSSITVDGVGYYLGENTGITHTFTDTTVKNGFTYYYAVVAYDHGDDNLGYYPSENAVTVSRTARGGTILPKNVVEVRPNPRASGFVEAAAGTVRKKNGSGTGSVAVNVVNSSDVPDGRTMLLRMKTIAPENVRADYYQLVDSASGTVYIERGSDFEATGKGEVGAGLIPLVSTIPNVQIDADNSGFLAGSQGTVRMNVTYALGAPSINHKRPGFPFDMEIEFFATSVDTSLPLNFLIPGRPVKYKVWALTPQGKLPLKTFFTDGSLSKDSTLNSPDDIMYIATDSAKQTWSVKVDTTAVTGAIVPPQPGDVYRIALRHPFADGEEFAFRTTGQRIDAAKAGEDGLYQPYVVPNPYVAAAAFEPERFAVSGRGIRRIEFRGLPSTCTLRIYTVRGELVQTLRQENSLEGYLAWNLRTKDNLEVAPGLYIFHVDGGPLGEKTGKFAIIK
ncbi:MAG: hypothetical protein F9K22_02830 [Bacteroidetes bacterium]|nr:MAG: hypothetical protein F9K22_02830 [Bacteroidota bacterium]